MSNEIHAFSSADVSKLVGITTVYLNALVARKLYGIVPSISDRHGEMKLRIFGENDVFGIALIWMLFEGGLRTKSIREILFQLVETDEPDASAAADFIAKSEISHLVILRAPAKPKKNAKHWLRVEPTSQENLNELFVESVQKYPGAFILVAPVGTLFSELAGKIRAMYKR
jgi:hypothetical protein